MHFSESSRIDSETDFKFKFEVISKGFVCFSTVRRKYSEKAGYNYFSSSVPATRNATNTAATTDGSSRQTVTTATIK